jgi:hypothetical protein
VIGGFPSCNAFKLDALASDSFVPPFWPAPERAVSEDFADAAPFPEESGTGFVVAVGAQPNANETTNKNVQYAILGWNSIAASIAIALLKKTFFVEAKRFNTNPRAWATNLVWYHRLQNQ